MQSIEETAQTYIKRCAVVGIGLNVLLFAVKLICGVISGSVSIQADAINNLTDVAVAIISFLGVVIAGIGAGITHPFGHGRFEWITGIFSSMAVILLGGKLAIDSICAIRHPASLAVNGWIVAILLFAILIKGAMYYYNHKIGERIQSVSMKATAADSLGDMVSTIVILLSVLVEARTGLHVDGWGGLVVSLFVVYSGVQAMEDGIVRILGENVNNTMKQEIERMVLEYKEVAGISEFYIHDYGMGHSAISMHIEGEDNSDRQQLAMIAQKITYRIYNEYGCEATVQIDIVDTSKETYQRIEQLVEQIFHGIHVKAYINHMKVMPMETSTLITMEIACEHSEYKREAEIRGKVMGALKSLDPRYKVMIKVISEPANHTTSSIYSIFPWVRKSVKLKA